MSIVVHAIPLLAIAGYMAYPTQLRIDPRLLYVLSILHNGALVAFSAWTFVSIAHVLYTDGIVFEHGYYFKNPMFDRVMFWFYVSKYYEFFDTFLLYLNGKTPILLQKYHHIGAVISWHLCYVYGVEAIWIPSLANSFVHTVMYSYYLCCLLKINQVRFLKQYLTSLQLVQLVGSMLLSNMYYLPIESSWIIFVMMIVNTYNTILIVLFCSFFYANYLTPTR